MCIVVMRFGTHSWGKCKFLNGFEVGSLCLLVSRKLWDTPQTFTVS
jgi:hypothetical protein